MATSLKTHEQLTPSRRAALEAELGFDLPAYRLPYESFRTDYGIGSVGLHWVVYIMHLPAYRAARFNVVAAAEIDPAAVEVVRRKGLIDPDTPVTDDYHELIQRDDVAIVDSSFGHKPEKEHKKLALAEACAAAGKPLLIHKPAASTLGVAEQIEAISLESGVPICINQNCRYNPAAYSAKQLLDEERMGPPTIMEIQHYWRGDPKARSDRRAAWMQHFIHHADLLRWWAGAPCVSVYAKAQQVSTMAILEFENGVLAYHHENHTGTVDHENHFRIQTERGFITGSHNWNWHIGSARGRDVIRACTNMREPAVELPLPELIYEPHWSDITKWFPHSGPYYDLAAPVAGMMGCMGAIMRGLSEGRRPDNHISGGVESLRMALAAELSAETGRPVNPAEAPSDFTTRTEASHPR